MAESHVSELKQGIQDGLPICIGYFAAAVTFGIFASGRGLSPLAALFFSLTNLSSAGQFVGADMIAKGANYLEIIITAIVVNLRFGLLSLSLTQKVGQDVSVGRRFVMSYGITDETFAMAVSRKESVKVPYFIGLVVFPVIGWASGSYLGAVAAGFLPESLSSSLGIILYGMFLAILVPPASTSRPVLVVILLSAVLSCIFYYAPVFSRISQSITMVICVCIACSFAAFHYPMEEQDVSENGE